ncbi:MAG: GAF domain-containing protein [Myxococcota bacterium]
MAERGNAWRGEVWIPVAYLVMGAGWIAVSGALGARLAGDLVGLQRIEQVKGWAFILATTALLHLLLRGHSRRLETERARYRRLAEETLTGLVVAVDGHIVWANDAAQLLLQGPTTRQPLEGRALADFTPAGARTDLQRTVDALLAGAPVERFSRHGLRRPDGVPMDVDIGLTRTLWNGAPAVHLTLHDVTALNQLTCAFRLLAAGSRAALRTDDEAGLHEGVCRAVVESGGFLLAWIGLVDGERLNVVGSSSVEPKLLEALRPLMQDSPSESTPTAKARRERATVVVHDVATADDFPAWRAAVERHGVKAAIALPLTSGGETLGVLAAASGAPARFTAETVQVFERLADEVSFGLTRLRLAARAREAEDALRKREREARAAAALLRATYEAITDALVVYDDSGTVVAANEAARVGLGADPTGWSADAVAARVGLAAAPLAVRQALAGASTVDAELVLPALPELSFRFSAFPVRDGDGQVTGAVTLLRDDTERVRQAAALRALATRFDRARATHEAHLARELHDDLGQSLTALKLQLATLEAQVDAPDAPARALLDPLVETSALVDEMLVRLKRIVAGLRPHLLEQLGLPAALRAEARGFAARTGLACDLSINDALAPDPETSAALFRIAQEALTNVARHATATRVVVTLDAADGALRLVVRDDGRGFRPEEVSLSLGLFGMRERAAALGGQLRVDSAPGAGATVTAWVPWPPPSRGGDDDARAAGR